jgi:hypothetical protein
MGLLDFSNLSPFLKNTNNLLGFTLSIGFVFLP